MQRTLPSLTRLMFAAATLLTPMLASAHDGAGMASGFLTGMLHPLSGLDHLCAMLAVGLWAAQLAQQASVRAVGQVHRRHAVWGLPLAFVTTMIIGSLLPASGFAAPFVEQGIVASLFVLGLLIAFSMRLPFAASLVLVGLFALFHGHAHGAEIPPTASGFAYICGFALTTALLHLTGVGGAAWLQASARPLAIRAAGALIAALGSFLWFAPAL